MIVADTHLIAYLLIRSDLQRLARRALQMDRTWAAPVLWRSGFYSVLAGFLRRRALDLMTAKQIAESARFLMKGREHLVSPSSVLDLVSRST